MIKLLTISLTSRCDRSCAYCPVAKWRNNSDYPDMLTLESTIEFIDRAKPTHIEITGGEPTMVEWLGELCGFLAAKGIIYLVKSNGYKRCPNQISAWHGSLGEMPRNRDKILIIKGTEEWEAKRDFCEALGVPHGVIGFGKDNIRASKDPARWVPAQQLFLCPDGHLKMCSEHELLCPEKPKRMEDDFEWVFTCVNCKAVSDFFAFL
jgi:hypothetical protein